MAVVNGANETSVVYGTDLVLLVEIGSGTDVWQPIAHATTHSIELTRDERETSSKSTGDWNLKDYAKISWSGSVDGLVSFDTIIMNYATLVDKQIAREKMKIISVLKNEGVTPLDDDAVDLPIDDNSFVLASPTYEGEVIITSVSITAGEGENATFSLSFSGASPLEKATVEPAV